MIYIIFSVINVSLHFMSENEYVRKGVLCTMYITIVVTDY